MRVPRLLTGAAQPQRRHAPRPGFALAIVTRLQVGTFPLLSFTVVLAGCLTTQPSGAPPRHVAGEPPRAERLTSADSGLTTEAASAKIVSRGTCALPDGVSSVPAAVSSQDTLIPLCTPGKTESLVSAAAAWFKAAPSDPSAASWLSQGLYIRALEGDGLRSPCAPQPVFIDEGPPRDRAEALLYAANQNAQIGWDHIIRSPDARRDAEASLCFAESSLASRFDMTVFRRRLRILLDLGRDAELRASIREISGAPERVPGGIAKWFSVYVPDYLGAGREIEAGELAVLLRELDPDAAPRLDDVRRAIVLQSRRRYPEGTAARQRVEGWIAAHGFDVSWMPSQERAPKGRRQ